MTETGTDSEQELYRISHLVNPTKDKNIDYTPVLLGNANGRLSKANFFPLRILLESGASFSIVLRKHTKNTQQKYPAGQMEHPSW